MTEHWMRRIATFLPALNACWLQVSANQGHARAEAVTAMAFRDGEGVPRNYATAFLWAQKSAEQGDAVGEAVLGQLYNSGFGTPRNPQLSQYSQSKAQAQLSVLQARQPQPQPQQSQPSPFDVFVAFCKLTGCDQLPHATSQSDEQKRQAEKDAAVNADECLAAKGYWHPNYGADYYGSGRCW